MDNRNRMTVAALCLVAVIVGGTVGAGSDPGEVEFPGWLVPGDPTDETIRYFWERADRDELDAESLVDLGTLIFDRGHPDEAIDFYKQALKVDSDMYEAWFRIGLVEHTRGDLNNAEQAYSRCLKKRPGHAWCNFYYGLLEEQLGHSSNALKHYEMAFSKAPRLADPGFNPEVMFSRLAVAAKLRTYDVTRFEEMMPMRLLQPAQVNAIRRLYEADSARESPASPESQASEMEPESETEAAPAVPVAQPTPAATSPAPRAAPPPRRVPTRPPSTPPPSGADSGGSRNETPYGSPMVPITSTSDEARLRPAWAGLWELSERLV
jgi:hypothetical protein